MRYYMGASISEDYEPLRFPNVDPLTKKYPELTPYQFASNTPIMAIDLDGLEGLDIHTWMLETTASMAKSLSMANKRADAMIRTLDRIQPNGATTFDKFSVYTNAYLGTGVGNYTDANDVSVLTQGRNMDNSRATKSDYVFAAGGLLLPVISGSGVKNIISTSLDKFKDSFVDNFANSNTRANIMNNYDIYLQKLKAIVGKDTQFSQLIGGSFVDKKINPNDLDMVTYLPYEVYDKNKNALQDLREYAKNNLNLDAFHKPFYPEGHRKHETTFKKEFNYWLDIFGTDRNKNTRNILLIEH